MFNLLVVNQVKQAIILFTFPILTGTLFLQRTGIVSSGVIFWPSPTHPTSLNTQEKTVAMGMPMLQALPKVLLPRFRWESVVSVTMNIPTT